MCCLLTQFYATKLLMYIEWLENKSCWVLFLFFLLLLRNMFVSANNSNIIDSVGASFVLRLFSLVLSATIYLLLTYRETNLIKAIEWGKMAAHAFQPPDIWIKWDSLYRSSFFLDLISFIYVCFVWDFHTTNMEREKKNLKHEVQSRWNVIERFSVHWFQF